LGALLEACSPQSLPFDPFAKNPPNLGDVVPISTPSSHRLIARVSDYIYVMGFFRRRQKTRCCWIGRTELSPEAWHHGLMMAKNNGRCPSSTRTLLDCRNLYESD
jgi:hypothetical protein